MKSILSCGKKNPFSVVLFYVDVSPHQLIDILLSVNHPVLIFKSRRVSRLRCAEQEAARPAAMSHPEIFEFQDVIEIKNKTKIFS